MAKRTKANLIEEVTQVDVTERLPRIASPKRPESPDFIMADSFMRALGYKLERGDRWSSHPWRWYNSELGLVFSHCVDFSPDTVVAKTLQKRKEIERYQQMSQLREALFPLLGLEVKSLCIPNENAEYSSDYVSVIGPE